ncbi:MAG: outer membrane protein assembly factor BamB [Kiritimatiellia bacterium]|jgi:outer membrane protein assembly factor BamB
MKYALPLLSLALTSTLFAGSWPEWRGPDGMGHAEAQNIPTEFGEEKNVAWKTEIPGRGWSSPLIEGNQVWMTTAFETAASPEEAAERLKADTGGQKLTVLSEVKLHAICVDKTNGKILHDLQLLAVKNPQWVHQMNSYASPTPILKDGKLYAHFGVYGTACVDTQTTKILWVNQEIEIMHENGPGSSPVLWKDRLIFHCDGSDTQHITALDTTTGKEAWKTMRSGKMNENPQLKKAYGTPIILTRDGQTELVSPAADWLYAYDPADGKELWKVPYDMLGFSNVSRPVAGNGMIFTSTCFMKSTLLGIDHTPEQPVVSWRYTKGVPAMGSPLLVGDELYFVSDKVGFITCLDAQTGEERYRERLSGNFSGSPIFADGKMFFANREGEVFVVKPGKTFELLAKNTFDGMFFATPAFDDSSMFLRTDKALYRIAGK